MDRQRIAKLIRERLQEPPGNRFKLDLFEEGIRHEDDWWYVPVLTQLPDVDPFDYAPVLNKIEKIFEDEGTNLLLVPAESV